ncbi:class I SAM-dependent methyltransferase [Candidatus Woesearchaeota archaeon]|nr:class I SAM-dependent methyltransferase [Candidatus Woesearchaeota archaeon]
MTYESWKNIEGKDVPSTSGFSEKVLEYLKPNSVVLDLGCGYGRLSGFFASKGCRVYGIDINENAIEEAKKNPELKDIEFSVQDATNTNFENNFFDVVVSQAVFACMDLPARKKLISECYRILKPSGILCVSEFGQIDENAKYEEHAKATGEYGTVIVKNPDETERFRTHNFAKSELEKLIEEAGLKVLSYENPDFTTISGNSHPGHIFICQK